MECRSQTVRCIAIKLYKTCLCRLLRAILLILAKLTSVTCCIAIVPAHVPSSSSIMAHTAKCHYKILATFDLDVISLTYITFRWRSDHTMTSTRMFGTRQPVRRSIILYVAIRCRRHINWIRSRFENHPIFNRSDSSIRCRERTRAHCILFYV